MELVKGDRQGRFCKYFSLAEMLGSTRVSMFDRLWKPGNRAQMP